MRNLFQAVLCCFLILAISSVGAMAGTRATVEEGTIHSVSRLAMIYSLDHEGKLPDSWAELIESRSFFYENLTAPLNEDGDNFTDLYSFIRPEDREKFPDGNILLVRYRPATVSGYWQEVRGTRLFIRDVRGDLVIYERYFVFQDPDQMLRMAIWDEEKFQDMLADTGITIPPPQPLPPERPRPPSNQQQVPPRPPTPDGGPFEEGTEAPDPVRVPEPPVEQPHESPEEAADRANRGLFWIIGGVVALLVLLLGWRAMKQASRAK